MAQGTFTVTAITTAGIAPTLSSPSASGDLFVNNEREFIYATNGGSTTVNITIASQHKCNYGAAHDLTVSVPAGSSRIAGPFPTLWYSNQSDKVVMTYDSISNLTLGVFRLS